MDPSNLPLKLYPTHRRRFVGVLALVVVAAMGLFLINQGEAVGWIAAIFSGTLLILIVASWLLPNHAYLIVDSDGFELSNFYRKHRYQWQDIAKFGTHKQGFSTFVGFSFADGVRKQTMTRRLSQALSDVEFILPSTYGMSAEELVQLLNGVKEANQLA